MSSDEEEQYEEVGEDEEEEIEHDDDGDEEKEDQEEEVEENENDDEQQDDNAENDDEENEDEVPVNRQDDEKASEAEPESDEEFAGFKEDEIKINKKLEKRRIASDDEVDDEDIVEENENSNLDQEQDNDDVEQVIENEEIVDDENAEIQNEDENDIVDDIQNDESDDESELSQKKRKLYGESDLDAVIKKREIENKKKYKRKKGDSELLTNADTMIANLVTDMKNVAAEDRAANEKSICAVQKLKMLPLVINVLQKSDYHATMIELGILGAMAEWLAPLPDRSLPNLKIREELVNALQEFGDINADYLKSSGIGKAAMFLYKHPKETKNNKIKLEKLINNWARPIFNLDSNFKQLSKEERQQRDMEHVKSLQRRTLNEESSSHVDINNVLNDEKFTAQKQKKTKNSKSNDKDETQNKVLRPGDPGFCPRARVPLPSNKDYVVRPKSNLDNIEMQTNEKKQKKVVSRIDKHKRRFIDIKRQGQPNKAALMSIEGKKMGL